MATTTTITITTEDYNGATKTTTKEVEADYELDAGQLARTIRKKAPTLQTLVLTDGSTGETIHVKPSEVWGTHVNNTEERSLNYSEYEIYKELILSAPLTKTSAGASVISYVSIADEATGTLELTIPLSATPFEAGQLKSHEHNEGRKWRVQARLRNKARAKGLEVGGATYNPTRGGSAVKL